MRKEGKDSSDNANNSCVAISVLCESSVVRTFSPHMGDLSSLPSFVSGKKNLHFLRSIRIALPHGQRVILLSVSINI